jgi:hypothetical protein
MSFVNKQLAVIPKETCHLLQLILHQLVNVVKCDLSKLSNLRRSHKWWELEVRTQKLTEILPNTNASSRTTKDMYAAKHSLEVRTSWCTTMFTSITSLTSAPTAINHSLLREICKNMRNANTESKLLKKLYRKLRSAISLLKINQF